MFWYVCCARQPEGRRIRRFEVLYAVQRLGDRWRKLKRRKEVRAKAYEAAMDDAHSDEDREAILSCISALAAAKLEHVSGPVSI